jgi:hypothetical protein
MPIYTAPDNVIGKPDVSAYFPKRTLTRPDSTGISNYGLSKLVDQGEALDDEARMQAYQRDTQAANEQRAVLSQIAAQAEAANEARKQNLDFVKGNANVPQGPAAAAYGIPTNPAIQNQMDALMPQSVLAKIAAEKASANASNASATKSRSDATKVKTKYTDPSGLSYEVNGAPQEADLSSLPPNVRDAMLNGSGPLKVVGDRVNSGGGSSIHEKAATAAAPVAVVMPDGKSTAASNAVPDGNGNFIVDATDARTKTTRKVIVKKDGSYVGTAD